MKDKLHILLSLPNFVPILYSVLSHEYKREKKKIERATNGDCDPTTER